MSDHDKTESFTERVAQYFRVHPNQWVSYAVLMQIGGSAAWRSRVSNCRTELNMHIQNRTRRVIRNGHWYVESEYRYVPPMKVETISGKTRELFA